MRLDRATLLTISVAVAALVAALYLPMLSAPWEYDDKVEIVGNRILRTPGEVGAMVEYNPFRVLLLYSFAWDIWAWGLRVEPLRAMNILIHTVNALLVARITATLMQEHGVGKGAEDGAARIGATAAALIFAAHPLAIESVTYISGRSASLATMFVLLSIDRYIRFRALEACAPEDARKLVGATRSLGWILGAFFGLSAGAAALGSSLGWSGERTTVVAVVLGSVAGVLAGTRATRWDLEGTTALRRPLALAFIAFVCAALTKEIGAVTPALLFLVELHHCRSVRGALGRLAGPLLPFVAVPLLLVALRAAAYGYFASPTFIRPWTTNLLTEFEVHSAYARLWVWPQGLSIYHDWPLVPPPGSVRAWLSAGVSLVLVAVAIRGRRQRPILLFAVLGTLAALLPESSVFALKETMAEHRTYLPSAPLSVGLGAAFALLWRRAPHSSWGLLATVVLGLSTAHHLEHRHWETEEGLWSRAALLRPGSADIERYLGDLYVFQDRFAEAEQRYARAIDARPRDATLISKLGQVIASRGRLDEARLRFIEALAFDACHTPAHNNLAQIERLRGAPSVALEHYARAVRCDARAWIAHRGMAEIYDRDLGDPRRAAMHYERAIQHADPYHPEAQRMRRRLQELTF